MKQQPADLLKLIEAAYGEFGLLRPFALVHLALMLECGGLSGPSHLAQLFEVRSVILPARLLGFLDGCTSEVDRHERRARGDDGSQE